MAFTSPEESPANFVAAFNAGDRAAILDFYEPGAMVIAEPGQPVTGLEAIGAVIDGFLATGGKLTMAPSYCYVNGELALTGAAWSIAGTDAGGKPVDVGSGNNRRSHSASARRFVALHLRQRRCVTSHPPAESSCLVARRRAGENIPGDGEAQLSLRQLRRP